MMGIRRRSLDDLTAAHSLKELKAQVEHLRATVDVQFVTLLDQFSIALQKHDARQQQSTQHKDDTMSNQSLLRGKPAPASFNKPKELKSAKRSSSGKKITPALPAANAAESGGTSPQKAPTGQYLTPLKLDKKAKNKVPLQGKCLAHTCPSHDDFESKDEAEGVDAKLGSKTTRTQDDSPWTARWNAVYVKKAELKFFKAQMEALKQAGELESKRGGALQPASSFGPGEDEAEEAVARRRWLVSCESRFVALWSLFMGFSSVLFILLIPMDFAFDFTETAGLGVQVVEYLLEIAFVLDVLLHFNMSYLDQKNREEIWDRPMITKNYLKRGFKLDALTSIPVNCMTLIATLAGSSATNVANFHVLKLLRISKLSRLLNARRTVREIEALSSNPAVVRMMKIFLVFIGVSHYLGCMTHYFICTFNGGFDPDTEIYQDRCSYYDDMLERYTSSWLQSLKAIYGSVESGHAIEEQRMEMFILIVGLTVSSTIIGGLSSLLGSLDRTQAAKNEELDNVKEFCRRMKVPPDLRQRMLGYFNYVWEIGSSLYLQQVYEQLPPRLCLELRLRLNRGFVRQCPLLSVFPGAAVAALVEGMEAVIVMPDDPVVQQGQAVSRFFLISRGRCGVSHQELAAPSKRRPPPLPETPSSPTLGQGVGAFLAQGGPGHGRAAAVARQQSGRLLQALVRQHSSGVDPAGGRLHKLAPLLSGSHFGDHQVLGLEEKSSVNIISEVYGELQVVPGDILISVLDSDPLLKATMMQISRTTLAAQMATLRDLLGQPEERKDSSFHLTDFRKEKTVTRSGQSVFKDPHPDKTSARIDFQADAVRRWKLVQAACKETNFDLEKNRNDQAASLDQYINDKVTHLPQFPAVFHSKTAHHVQEDLGRGRRPPSFHLDLTFKNNRRKQNSYLSASNNCLEEGEEDSGSMDEQRQERKGSCSQISQQMPSSSCLDGGGSLEQKLKKKKKKN